MLQSSASEFIFVPFSRQTFSALPSSPLRKPGTQRVGQLLAVENAFRSVHMKRVINSACPNNAGIFSASGDIEAFVLWVAALSPTL